MQRIMNLQSKGYAINFHFPALVVADSNWSTSFATQSKYGHMLQCCYNLCHEENLKKYYTKFAPTEYDQNPQHIEDFGSEILIRMNELINGKNVADKMITLNIHSENYTNNLQMVGKCVTLLLMLGFLHQKEMIPEVV